MSESRILQPQQSNLVLPLIRSSDREQQQKKTCPPSKRAPMDPADSRWPRTCVFKEQCFHCCHSSHSSQLPFHEPPCQVDALCFAYFISFNLHCSLFYSQFSNDEISTERLSNLLQIIQLISRRDGIQNYLWLNTKLCFLNCDVWDFHLTE